MTKKRHIPQLALKKGMILMVKAPPYYTQEYPYEITSAGSSRICANLLNSPKVRKSWSADELALLIEMAVVRVSTQRDLIG
jgi:hypothetical protein